MFYKCKKIAYFMKTNKLFLVLTGILLLVSALQFTSACKHNEYDDLNNNYDLNNGDDVIFIIRDSGYYSDDSSKYWENEKRLPVYEYRNGYSYRATKDYQEDLNERIYRNTYIEYGDSYEKYNSYSSKRINFQEEPEYYYTYDDYMRTYTKHTCYSNPPADKLIYVKCP